MEQQQHILTCHSCAIENGGQYQHGKRMNWHKGVCSSCRKFKNVTNKTDYRFFETKDNGKIP